jgi:hypothetical protein
MPLTLAITYWAISLSTIVAVALPLLGTPRSVYTSVGGVSVIVLAIGHYALRVPSIKSLQEMTPVRDSIKTRMTAKLMLYLTIGIASIITGAYMFFLTMGLRLSQSPGILILLPFALNIQIQGNHFLSISKT